MYGVSARNGRAGARQGGANRLDTVSMGCGAPPGAATPSRRAKWFRVKGVEGNAPYPSGRGSMLRARHTLPVRNHVLAGWQAPVRPYGRGTKRATAGTGEARG